MNKKVIAIILSVVMAICMCSCGDKKVQNNEDKKLNIVTTIFPEYDWVRNITGDSVNLTLLLDSGVDLHNFQPTADDVLTIASSNLFIYVGGESDDWVDGIIETAQNTNLKTINLLEVLGDKAKEEELIEGMQGEEEESEEEEVGPEYDEHVWLSLKNAEIFVKEINDTLCEIDKDNAGKYTKNAETYINELNVLDDEYKKATDNANNKTLLFGDRFPFRYMVDDYGLDYYAAFIGCSAETEASFETITFLSNKYDELGLHKICVIENSDCKIAETIKSNTANKDAGIVKFNSMQNIINKDISSGRGYIDIMRDNLDSLKEAIK